MNDLKLLIKLELKKSLALLKSNKHRALQVFIWIFSIIGFITVGGLLCMLYFIAMAQSYGGIDGLPENIELLKDLMKGLPDFIVYLIFIYNFIVYFLVGRQYFVSEDEDIVLSLPFSIRNIILGKFITGIIFSLVGNLIITLPSLVLYSILYRIKTLIPFLLLIIIASILGFALGLLLRHVLYLIFPRLHWPKWVRTVVFLVLFPPLFALYMYKISNQFAQLSQLLYRFILWYQQFYGPTDFIKHPLLLIPALLVTALVTACLLQFIYKYFYKFKSKDQIPTKTKKFDDKSYQVHSPMVALILKEYRLYWSITPLVQNSATGAALLLMVSIACLFPAVREFVIQGLTQFSTASIDIILFFVLLMGAGIINVCYLSFSAEQQQAYNTYVLPLSASQIFLGKLMGPLLFVLPFYLISCLLLIYSFKPSGMYIPFLILGPLLYLIFSNGLGLFFDSKMANYDWDNPAKLVKNSKQAFFSSFGSFILSILIILIGFQIMVVYPLLFIIILTVLLFIANIILLVLIRDMKIYHQ